MAGALAHMIPFESRRVPLERRITLKFQHREGFVNEYASNISLKGMFITAWVPEPPGSIFLFEIQVADRQRLIHGVGEVVWVRQTEESPDRSAGMGVRFLKLDDSSRAVIDGMVKAHVERGGTPFDPTEAPEGTVALDDLVTADRELTPEADPHDTAVLDLPFDEAPADEAAVDAADGDHVAAAEVVFDPRLLPPEGRAMSRRPDRAQLSLWLLLGLLLAGSVALVLLT